MMGTNKTKTRQRGKVATFFLSIFMFVMAASLILGFVTLGLNIYVRSSVKKQLISFEDAVAMQDVDCIIVLGASVRNGDTPSPMLEDRLKKGMALYFAGAAPKILMSGDHGSEYYNEVGVMKHYAVERGVNADDVFLDHAGFSTYESMYRAKEIFGAKKVLIVTQSYHLTRAVYDARKLGLIAYGVAAEDVKYGGQFMREVREALAINKDFFMTLLKPEPKLLGAPISLDGSGSVTDDTE